MTTQTIDAGNQRQAYLVIGGLAAVWVIAAMLRPDTTFHLGPIILPLIPLIVAPKAARMTGVVVAIAVGAGVTAVLSITGNLSGPSLEPSPSALAESMLTLVGSGVLALGFARLTR